MHSTMRAFIYILLLTFTLLLLNACTSSLGQRYIETDSRGAVVELKWPYQDKQAAYRVNAVVRQPVRLDDDTFSLSAIGEGAHIRITQPHSNSVFSIESVNGYPAYRLSKNGLETAVMKADIQYFMQGLFNATPLLAKERVSVLARTGGNDAVMKQWKVLTGDETLVSYSREISHLEGLTNDQISAVLFGLSKITSDDSLASASSYFIQQHGLSTVAHWQAFLWNLKGVSSDYALSQCLLTVAPLLLHDKSVHNAFFDVTDTVASDYEKYRLLSVLAKGQHHFSLPHIIDAGLDIGSDYETHRLVVELAPLIDNEASFQSLVSLLATIGSDYEMYRAVTQLPLEHFNMGQISDLITLSAGDIGSDYELANTLIYIAENVTLKGELLKTFYQAADAIGSTNERVKVYDALRH